MNDLLETFYQECDDLLEGLSSGLNDLENGAGDEETVNAMFRSVHSIKGGAGAFGLDELVSFAHAFENVLDDVRSGKTAADGNVVALMFSASDHLCDLVEAARNEDDVTPEQGASILSDLKLLTQSANGGAAEEEADAPAPEFVPLSLDMSADLPPLDDDPGALPELGAGPLPDLEAGPVSDLPDLTPDTGAEPMPASPEGFAIQFAAHAALYESGNDPALLFRALEELGDVHITADRSGLTAFNQDDWHTPQLRWHITLHADDGVDQDAIREVFEFVDGACDLSILPPADHAAALPELTPAEDPGAAPDGLPDLPRLTADADADGAGASEDQASDAETGTAGKPCAPAQSRPNGTDGTDGPDGPDSTAPANPDAAAPQSATAPKKPGDAKPAAQRSATIRVDLQRVDRLINLVGELVISEAMLRQSMHEHQNGANSTIEEAMGQLKQLSGSIQESVMAIRAQPVRGLFQRMARIVRESAREAGKQAKLVTLGDATEVDKTVTERLVEPLTHMIRNAIDHGLEPPEIRAATGKSERGEVTLAAKHRSGRVVISLSDDGAGIDRPKVRQIAEAKGLIRSEDELSDTEIDNLLFRPGFSTAEEVSNLSGRGVGMDVVRSEIQALGGRVTLHSQPGEGTTLTISLPLTLAVLEGMVVVVENEALVVPTLALRETLQPGQASVNALCDGDLVLSMNGELIPIIDLGAALGYRAAPGDFGTCALLLVEGESGRRTALAVDRIVDQREVVIKGLEQNYRQIPGIAAATILGDGNIALIVDTEQMIAAPVTRSAAETSRAATPAAAIPGGAPSPAAQGAGFNV